MANFKIGDMVRHNSDQMHHLWEFGRDVVEVTDVYDTAIRVKGSTFYWGSKNFHLVKGKEDDRPNFFVAIPMSSFNADVLYNIYGPMRLNDARDRAKAVEVGATARIFFGVEEITSVRSFETKVLN